VDPSGEMISVETAKEVYQTRSLIVAPGSRVRKLGVPGEEEFLGKGVYILRDL